MDNRAKDSAEEFGGEPVTSGSLCNGVVAVMWQMDRAMTARTRAIGCRRGLLAGGTATTTTEYALLLGLLGMVTVVAVALLGTSIGTIWNNVNNGVSETQIEVSAPQARDGTGTSEAHGDSAITIRWDRSEADTDQREAD